MAGNKKALGRHAWGNVVPCCNNCNSEKQQQDWQIFLKSKAQGETYRKREKTIRQFVQDKEYDPNLNLEGYAGNLYEDVGAVAMALIELRLEQAKEAIQRLLK